MGKKKYYAVRKGYNTGIFESWVECQQSINGYSNAEYKSFGNIEDARVYIDNKDIRDVHKNTAIKLDTPIAYIDGSYSDEAKKYSFGCVILMPNGEKIKESGYGNETDALKTKNVAGELQGAMYVIKFLSDKGYKKAIIRHDYIGISKWFTGEWKAKNNIVKKYVEFMSRYKNIIDISFQKVQAHSGDKFNEEVDALAKNALNGKQKIKEDEYGLIAQDIDLDDLESIIDLLKEDIKDLSVKVSERAYFKMYVLTVQKERVVVKYYSDNNGKLIVQGNPEKLFSLFSTYVTELVDTDKIPIIFNKFYDIDIKKDNIEKQYKIYLSKASNELPEKIQRVLHQAVYNLNFDGDMYDPTYLVFPTYRALEGVLKFILKKYGIQYNGSFNMFTKRINGTHKLMSKYEPKIGSPKKIAYINKCFNYYFNNRNTLFHWDDPCGEQDTTRLINSTEQARKSIRDTLDLIENFFNMN
ncbi:viroplasmin family protein [Clostridium sp. AWRP]|uniref:ribonuclease H1 domain-containing protein n=1 Tax=Clostridium sp. AWRP TaxID=2212991 RepID=UPI000FDB6FB8|nr:viroplasmin family protein [Clostridium sp. AWRP]AZV58936.1 hypothetical protein DMR38_21440 [Clostridium sp. AWRP]